MASASLLAELSDQFVSLANAAGSRTVQVGGGRVRPASGTVFAAERILVAAHSVDSDNGLQVRDASGEVRAADYLGADAATDLAVLRVPGLTVEPLAAAGEPRIGQLLVALGRTASGALAASAGVLSVVGGPLRTGRGRSIEQVIRADVRVHPLGAGGPLLDVDGRVVGIATGASLRGLPLFVPASIAWRVGETVSTHGSTRRGYLGVSAQPVRIPDRQRHGRSQNVGLLVIGIADGSPAEQAGLLLGDILVGLDGQPIEDHDRLLGLLSGDRVGKAVTLEVLRGGDARTIAVVVGERR